MYQRKDSFYTRAKRAGYRSRAAYKLEELANRYRILRAGDHVVDLGAWPGGWLQVAAQAVGPTGRVIGVDLQKIDPLPGAGNVFLVQGDLLDPASVAAVRGFCEGRIDVVLSDLSPKLSGVKYRDDAAALELAGMALGFACEVLRPGGILVVKLFMSPDLSMFRDLLRARFTRVQLTRPEATRKGSAEIYVVASGLRS